MRFAIDVPNFGPYADPRTLAQLAHEAEGAGWDGFFIWDHVQVGWPDPVGDPTVALAAIALATQRVKFGAMVTPLPRRHPWKVARETVTLDHLSNGRLILGIGLGADSFAELSTFGVPTDDMIRAEMLDEALAIIVGLWRGEMFSFDGKYYTVRETQFLPRPLQSPRIPIWAAGTWPHPRPFRRAARYEGVVPISPDIEKDLTPAETRAIIDFIRLHRKTDGPFEFVHAGNTPGKSKSQDTEIVASFADAGATWWFEAPLPWGMSFEEVRTRIRSGPPRF
jgi:alkanesulfonate monooxygenase SsuD/methylene tetrahydromethanopterin reductase-like flavin-dependent oxidoreductase (luciferase family)